MMSLGRKLLSKLILLVFGLSCLGSKSARGDVYTFTTFNYPGAVTTAANGINNSGQVVGLFTEAPSGSIQSGFLYDNGNFSSIRFPGATYTYATGISNNGLIVGSYSTGNVGSGFLYDHGSYTTIRFPGSVYSVARAVNSAGQIVGYYTDATSRFHGFLFDGGSYESIDVPGASGSSGAVGINDLGHILLLYNLGVQAYAAIDDGGNFVTIALPSYSYQSFVVRGINNLNQIVGDFTDNLGIHGFIYDHGVIQIFQVPESVTTTTITSADGINDFGEIAGYWEGASPAEGEHAYVATPVPEAGTLGLVASGFVILAAAIRKRLAGCKDTLVQVRH